MTSLEDTEAPVARWLGVLEQVGFEMAFESLQGMTRSNVGGQRVGNRGRGGGACPSAPQLATLVPAGPN